MWYHGHESTLCETPQALSTPAAKTHAVLVKAAQNTMVHVTKVRNKRLLHEMAAFQREPVAAACTPPSGVFLELYSWGDHFPAFAPVAAACTPLSGACLEIYSG